ncbi:MAG: dihydrofolate reductase [Alistipes sp.]|nr:dihydrofolate reductase [Alistipes sp.]MBR2116304.1 dihydrofolate reductase [Alistipes sp.]
MISIIVAIAKNGVIGDKNTLLWHLREDMIHFRTITSGHPVVMGRKTYDSIGRPLPKRTNVVITRDTELQIEGCTMAHSLTEAVEMFDSSEEVFIIGGAQIYSQAMPIADRLYLTIIDKEYEGDSSFPEIDYNSWRQISCEKFERGEEFEYPFSFITLERV